MLGELATQWLKSQGIAVVHQRALGDAAAFQALVRGDIDLYADYTGTLRQSIFAKDDVATDKALAAKLAERGLRMTGSLGFENSYAIGVLPATAEQYSLTTVSDLQQHQKLKFGFTETFLNRGDGWPALKQHYGLPQRDPRGMAHELAYVALASGDLDVIDLYTTDAEIKAYGLTLLEDDRNFFPDYQAVYLYREALETESPEVVTTLKKLVGAVSVEAMQAMNGAVRIDEASEAEAAAEFLNQTLGQAIEIQKVSLATKLWRRTREHLLLVGIAMAMGMLVALPLGVLAYRVPAVGKSILTGVSVLQTIPSLALLALMVPLLGINSPPAIAALFLYSLLPMVRNTYAGLSGVDPALHEAAAGLGMTHWQKLWQVELPLATPTILAGIKTSTVLSIGFATLGAFVGAGGYGEPILTGIRLQDTAIIMQGAIPAALLAVFSEFAFNWGERHLLPRGITS